MKHPLLPHYRSQLAALLDAEARFQAIVGEMLIYVPSLTSYLGGMETESHQRTDSLELLLKSFARTSPPHEVTDGVPELLSARGNTERQEIALGTCARIHHKLINDYRIARELAHRVEWHRHASRIDQLLSKMTDSFPSTKNPEISQRDPASIAG